MSVEIVSEKSPFTNVYDIVDGVIHNDRKYGHAEESILKNEVSRLRHVVAVLVAALADVLPNSVLIDICNDCNVMIRRNGSDDDVFELSECLNSLEKTCISLEERLNNVESECNSLNERMVIDQIS